uniref:Uncharacterized protein n=1 Tax=Siphoviridae sp. ctPAi1 TaxID=2826320 RepID=A0A8S5M8H5_9CAUD|nr:MAG TPA: hypothetical protein [Siphoviridae sp. ctPAi1]
MGEPVLTPTLPITLFLLFSLRQPTEQELQYVSSSKRITL